MLVEQLELSERRACRVIPAHRSRHRYRAKAEAAPGLTERLLELAAERRRFGYERLHLLLRREGWRVNHKRVLRLYRQEGLALRRRKRKRYPARVRQPLAQPTAPHQHWSMDFVRDTLADGRVIRMLTVVDDYSRQCLAINLDISLPGTRVVRVMDRLVQERGKPALIRTDNGPEFVGRALDQWAYENGVKLDFIQPGKPAQNGYIESFNGKLRDECLNQHWFLGLADAKRIVASWRDDYNHHRPHTALGGNTPAEAACSRNQTRGGHYGSCYQNLPCNVAYYEAKIHMLSSNLGSGSRRRERCSAANIGHYVSGVLDADLEGRDFGRP